MTNVHGEAILDPKERVRGLAMLSDVAAIRAGQSSKPKSSRSQDDLLRT